MHTIALERELYSRQSARGYGFYRTQKATQTIGKIDLGKRFIDFKDTKKTSCLTSYTTLMGLDWTNTYRSNYSLLPRHTHRNVVF